MKDSPNFSEFSPSVMRKQINQIYEFGEFRLETAERLLLTSQGPKPLRPKEFDTLLVLVQQSGHLIEKEELIRRVWPDTAVEEANLARNIYSLRKALGDDNHAHKYIETVPTRGYRFIAPVRELTPQSPDLLVQTRIRARIITEEEATGEPALLPGREAVAIAQQYPAALKLRGSSRARRMRIGLFVLILLIGGIGFATYLKFRRHPAG